MNWAGYMTDDGPYAPWVDSAVAALVNGSVVEIHQVTDVVAGPHHRSRCVTVCDAHRHRFVPKNDDEEKPRLGDVASPHLDVARPT